MRAKLLAWSGPLLGMIIACPAVSRAATVAVTVTGSDGRPLAGAVVTVSVPGAPAAQPHGSYVMAQRNIAFEPHILIVPVGAAVSFPNQDQVRHHVYSFSATKKFEIKLYGFDETKTVTFDKPGVAALGCNIHDSMSGFIFVTATPYAAISDGAGHVTIGDVPAGAVTLAVWHPKIRAPNNTLAQPAMVPAGGLTKTVAVAR